MPNSKRRHPERDFTPTHPHAAAIDIGSRMHVAAVPPDRDTEPVRAFGTCTGDLQQLADWFERCGVRTMQRNPRAGCRRLVIETKRPMRRPSMREPHCMRSSAST